MSSNYGRWVHRTYLYRCEVPHQCVVKCSKVYCSTWLPVFYLCYQCLPERCTFDGHRCVVGVVVKFYLSKLYSGVFRLNYPTPTHPQQKEKPAATRPGSPYCILFCFFPNFLLLINFWNWETLCASLLSKRKLRENLSKIQIHTKFIRTNIISNYRQIWYPN